MSAVQFYAPPTVYLWWLMLHIAVRLNQQISEAPSHTNAENNATQSE